MSKTPNYDAKVKAILDAMVSGERVCALTGEKWTMTEEEIGWYKKFNVPPSKYAPLTRLQVSLSFYNCYQWWNHRHAETGAPLLTAIHPATGLKILPDNEWRQKDFSEMGVSYDANRSFFEQFRELQLRVPQPASMNVVEPINSISQGSSGDRNSYFVTLTTSENSLFSFWAEDVRESAYVYSSVNVFDSFFISNSLNIHTSNFVNCSKAVLSSDFVFFSEDVEHCFGVANRKHARYFWWDEQLSKGEWEKRREAVDFSRRDEFEKWKARWHTFLAEDIIWPENMNVNTTDCFGEYLYSSDGLHFVYDASHNSRHMFWCAHVAHDASDAAFTGGVIRGSDVYESVGAYESRDVKFSYNIQSCQRIEYSYQLTNCEDCFGCVGLQRKRFHIFNQPYSEEEYRGRVDELKCAMLETGEYGRFFPLAFSSAYFGQSGAVMFLGSDPSLWKKLGGHVFDPESAGALGKDLAEAKTYMDSTDVPASIDDLGDEWAGRPLFDRAYGRRYSLFKPEIAYYRRKRLAPPTQHFIYRMLDLVNESNKGIYSQRSCEQCHKKVTIACNIKYPNRRIYCKKCYLVYIEHR